MLAAGGGSGVLLGAAELPALCGAVARLPASAVLTPLLAADPLAPVDPAGLGTVTVTGDSMLG